MAPLRFNRDNTRDGQSSILAYLRLLQEQQPIYCESFKKIRVWDLDTSAELDSLDGFGACTFSTMAISQDGRHPAKP